MHEGNHGHQDGDDCPSNCEESAWGTGDLRPKDGAAVHPPEYTKFTRWKAFWLEKYFDIPGNGEEDKADEEDREADGEEVEGNDEDSHAGKAEYEQDERSQNHRHEQPIHHEPETNLSSKLTKTWQTQTQIKTYQVDIWGLQVWSQKATMRAASAQRKDRTMSLFTLRLLFSNWYFLKLYSSYLSLSRKIFPF